MLVGDLNERITAMAFISTPIIGAIVASRAAQAAAHHTQKAPVKSVELPKSRPAWKSLFFGPGK